MVQWLCSRLSPLRKTVLTMPWITTVGGAVHTNHCFWMKTATTWKPLEKNVLEAHVGQHALLSIKGYIIRWLFNNSGNFSTWCYVFLLAEKKGKVSGSQRLTSLELCHFHPGNVFVPIPQVEKFSGLCMEAIFSIWLLFWAIHATIIWSSIQLQSQITQEDLTSEVQGIPTF